MGNKYFKQSVPFIVFLSAAIISHTQTLSACTSHDISLPSITIRQTPLRCRFISVFAVLARIGQTVRTTFQCNALWTKEKTLLQSGAEMGI